jgi:hypothetical protein
MEKLKEVAAAIVTGVADVGKAVFSAVWPRSSAAREIERLAEHGYVSGATYEMDFSLSFDEAGSDAALAEVRQAGFTVTERAGSATLCYATARRRTTLRAYDLQRATSVLQRIVSRYYGYAAPIGPAARVYDIVGQGVSRRAPSSAA